jgi:hypothetical protein
MVCPVTPNLAGWILNIGVCARVIKPLSLIEQVKNNAEAVAEQYNGAVIKVR